MRRSRVRGILDDAKKIRYRAFHAATQLFRRTRSFRRITVVQSTRNLHWADGGGNVDVRPRAVKPTSLASLEHQVEGRLGGTTEMAESRLHEHVSQSLFARLRTESEANLLR